MDSIVFIVACLGAGGLLAVQAGANAQLSKAVGSPLAATTLQLLVAAVLLALAAAATGDLAAVWKLRDITWWHALGGTASAFYVVSTILLFPRLGAVVSVGLFIAGQMLASLALDGFGLLGVPLKEIGLSTLAGIFAVLAGAAAIVIGQSGGLGSLAPSNLGWIGLALLAGAVLPIQGAVNALLRDGIGAPLAVGTVSFVVATLAMVLTLVFATSVTDQHRPRLAGIAGMPWWAWLGGFAGATYVTTVFSAIPLIGAAAAIGLTVAGQQVASVFVDAYGWFRLPQRPVSHLRVSGVALVLIGVATIGLV